MLARPKNHQKRVARPFLARPIMGKNVFWPVLIYDPPVLNKNIFKVNLPCNTPQAMHTIFLSRPEPFPDSVTLSNLD